MKYQTEIFLSPTICQGSELIKGQEAIDYLRSIGLQFVHVDDNGRIQALTPKLKHITGQYLYRHRKAAL